MAIAAATIAIVGRAHRNAADPIGREAAFLERMKRANAIGAKGAAALQQQDASGFLGFVKWTVNSGPMVKV